MATTEIKTVEAQDVPAPAALDISITPSRHAVGRLEQLNLYMIITNKSSTEVDDLRVEVLNNDFSTVSLPVLAVSLPGYGSTHGTATIRANASAQFVEQQVLFTFSYNWSNQGRQVAAIQGSPVTLQVTRRFDEEARGLLGGSAALLYLLLPIIPLVLSYQVVDQLLASGRPKFPSFTTDYVLPAFLAALLLNLVLLVLFQQLSFDYSDPTTMLIIVLGSFALGALFAAARRYRELNLLARWRYKETDDPTEHLRKVLLRPDAAEFHNWTKGTDADKEPWSGILLEQPSAGAALGATFQVFDQNQAGKTELDVLFSDGHLGAGHSSRMKLIELLRSGAIKADFNEKVERGGAKLDRPVITRLKGFQPADPKQKDLVTRV